MGCHDSARDALWQQLDIVYFLRNGAQDIAWHTRSLFSRVDADRPIVRARLARIGEGAEVLIYVRDQKGLFARVCGYFDSRNLSILDARVHTTRHGYALDTFLVTDHGRARHYRELLSQIEHELAEWISKEHELPPPAPPTKYRQSRQSRQFPVSPSVQLQPDERGLHYLLSVTATDRLGLLYSIARVLAEHDLNVHTAKVLTLGERAEDVFLVSGAALGSAKGQLADRKRLARRSGSAASDVRAGHFGKQDIGVTEAGEVAHPHRIQNPVEVIAFVLHDSRMKAVDGAINRPSLQIDSSVTDF